MEVLLYVEDLYFRDRSLILITELLSATIKTFNICLLADTIFVLYYDEWKIN